MDDGTDAGAGTGTEATRSGSGPARAFREPLADALLPALMHRLNNATQLLAALAAVFAGGGGDALLDRRADDLAAASDTIDELGWVLAVLATAGGADLVLERRSASGLATLLDAVRDALGRRGVTLAIERPVPAPAPSVGDGWKLAWTVGALAFCACAELPRGARPAVAFARPPEGGWRVTIARGAEDGSPLTRIPAATAARIARELPEARVDETPGAVTLRVPAGWLRPADQRT